MRHFARYVILAPLTVTLAGPALAQAIPPGQSCGGLLCDIGMFGHKVPVGGEPVAAAPGGPVASAGAPTTVAAAEASDPRRLPCRDFLCHAFGQPYADAAPPPQPEPVAEATPETPTKHARKAKRKHLAKAEPATASAAAR